MPFNALMASGIMEQNVTQRAGSDQNGARPGIKPASRNSANHRVKSDSDVFFLHDKAEVRDGMPGNGAALAQRLGDITF